MKKSGKNKNWIYAAAINLVLLLVVWNMYLQDTYYRSASPDEFDVVQEAAGIVSQEGNCWVIGPSDTYTGKTIAGLGWPVPAGTYKVQLPYETDSDGNVLEIYSLMQVQPDNSQGAVFAEIPLAVGEKELVQTFTLPQDVSDLKMRVIYNTGTVKVGEPTVSSEWHYKDVLYVLLLFWILEAVFFYLWKKKRGGDSKAGWRLFLFSFLSLLALLASIPLLNDFFLQLHSHDGRFHIDRIAGLALWMENFSWKQPIPRINPLSHGGSGYPSPVYYPQLFLLFPALLVRGGCSLEAAYKIFVYCVNLLTAWIAYYSFYRLSKKRSVGLLGSALYVFSLYRLIDVYTRVAVGEYLAMAFFPLFFYALYEVIFRDGKKWPFLVLAMTAILQSHILSTAMCAGMGIVFVAAGIGRLYREPRRLAGLGMAAGITAAVNAWFILPFVQCSTLPVTAMALSNERLGDTAVYFSQMFATFVQSGGVSLPLGSTQGEMPLSVGGITLVGMALYLWYAAVRIRRQEALPVQEKLFFSCGILGLFLASTLFPWNLVEMVIKIPIQYVWRNLAFASVFLAYTSAVAFEGAAKQLSVWVMGNQRQIYRLALSGCVLMTVVGALPFMDSTIQEDSITKEETVGGGGDSLYWFSDVSYELRNTVSGSGEFGLEVAELVRQPRSLEAKLTIENASEESWVDLPIFYFPGYRLESEAGSLPIRLGEHGQVRFTPPNGVYGIHLYFEEWTLWKAADVFSICSIGFFGVWMWKKRKYAYCCDVASRLKDS